jgi:glycerophosphoryl diester phosphodiesterase
VILLDPGARPVIGHRGASGDFPENTLLAFAQALERGADALECDTRLTADGVPVVIHDATLDRTTNGQGPVEAVDLARLRRLDAGRGERVPTLAETLAAFPRTEFILEIKDRRAAGPARRVLADQHAERRVLVGAFDRGALRPFDTGFCRSAARSETAVFWAMARVGVPPFRASFVAFTVPERYGPVTVVSGAFVRAARRLGRPVHVWTVNDPAEGRRLRALGVSGIITNYPGRFCLPAERPATT